MEYLIALLIGVAASAGAVLPPGMLNMAVATTSLEAGKSAGLRYAAGVVTVFLVQTTIAIVGVNFLRTNPDIVELLSWWAIPVLVFLALFFLFKWYREQQATESIEQQREEKTVDNPYWEGISVSLMNFLAIPYFFAIGSWLMADGVLDPAVLAKAAFVVGASAGAMLILTAYASGAKWIDAHAHYITRNIHLLVGALFVVLAGVQSYRMFF
ncbi:threonine/homoserine/homoserine lactone efflux protein [Lewinella aquimaris]|uniref:Threonine/homoserine/homoserine lactone efflux protein n=1 Tax=Neolewinella aquimaris TaxID=1835722 RepID=A0A840E1W0_9BACT|nr:LysE family transporter [Neolewinella aquimaris]MBB4079544.1 threonine/homoserine/homoserine lactone efflux protein [Neolewinella aquimaris]